MSFEFEKDLKVEETNIPGLLVFDLPCLLYTSDAADD